MAIIRLTMMMEGLSLLGVAVKLFVPKTAVEIPNQNHNVLTHKHVVLTMICGMGQSVITITSPERKPEIGSVNFQIPRRFPIISR